MIRALPLAALVLAVAQTAAAAPSGLQVRAPWSRPAAAGTTGVGYAVIANRGHAPAVLVKVESPIAAKGEMHRSALAGGIMRMTPEPRVEIPAGGEVAFTPGGRHLMFVGLKRPLNPGDRLPATLTFADGRSLKVDFAVGDGSGPPAASPRR
jgi:periplasmic copper chaperone A